VSTDAVYNYIFLFLSYSGTVEVKKTAVFFCTVVLNSYVVGVSPS